MSLTIGSKAPDFAVNDQSGTPVSLSSLKGKKVVLYFYPRDMTPGCTAESCNLRDNYSLLQRKGYEVLGISTDDEKSHQKFIKKEKLPFRLLADTKRMVHELYGTWVEKNRYGRTYMGTARTTFIIDENGIITDIINKVDTENHTDQIIGKSTSAKPAKKATKSSTTKVAKIAKKKAPKKTVTKTAQPVRKTAKKK